MDDLAERLTAFSSSGARRGAEAVWDGAHKQLRRRRVARRTTLAVTAVGLATVIAAVVAAVTAHDRSAPVRTTPTTRAHAPANPQEQAAIALGRHLLDDVVLPAGARPFTGKAPAGLHAPLEFPGTRNLVFAHRLWTVNARPYDLWHFFQAHVPFRGQVGDGSMSEGIVRTWLVTDDLEVTPRNVSVGSLQLAITGNPAGPSVVRADTVVQWTKPRPADEFVPATDRTVTVSVVHISPASPSSGPIGKRVTTADPTLVQPLIRTFNQLHVTPPPSPSPGGCPGPGKVEYRVAFSSSPTATPDAVATIGRCGGVDVTVNGRTETELDDLPRQVLATDAAHVLGFTDPHFG